MRRLILGLDAGSSLTKAALFTVDGRQIGTARRRIGVLRPRPGWVETDPAEAWDAAAAVIREVLSTTGAAAADIAAVGLCAAMVGAWVVDPAGRPLRAGINWEDSRTQPLIDRMLADDPGLLSRIFDSDGCVLQQGCTLPVARWLLDHEAATMAAAAGIVSYKDFLRLRLTGRLAADRTEAAVAPGDAAARGRSDAMFALFGLQQAAALFPPALDSETVAGAVTAEAAAATGLVAGTPVAIGAGDVPASIIGAGALAAGTACTILGTTCLNGIVVDRPVFTPRDLGLLFTLPGDRWLRCMVNVAGTANFDWAGRALWPDLETADMFAQLEALARRVPIGADGVTYLPYLSDSGIIAPSVAPDARAEFAGLAPGHERAHLARALYEGIALSIRDCYDALERPVTEILLTGGGARSPFLAGLIADAMQRPVLVPDGSEFGARGAALLAATAIGLYPSIVAASAAIRRIARRHDPDPATAPAWAAALRRYRHHRDAQLGALPRRTGSANRRD